MAPQTEITFNPGDVYTINDNGVQRTVEVLQDFGDGDINVNVDGENTMMRQEDIIANIVSPANDGQVNSQVNPDIAQQEVQTVLSPQEQRKSRLGEIAKRIPAKGNTKLWTQAKAADVAEYIMALTDDVAKQQATVQQYIDNIKEKQPKVGGIEALELDEDIAFWEEVSGLITQKQGQSAQPVAESVEDVQPGVAQQIQPTQNENAGKVPKDVQSGTETAVAQTETEVNQPVGNADNLSSSEVPNNQFVDDNEMVATDINVVSKDGIIDPRNMSDEESVKRGDMLRNATAVDVEEGVITSTKDLSARKSAEKWWDENVAEPAFYDTEVGEVEISRNSIESSLAHRYGQAKLDAFSFYYAGTIFVCKKQTKYLQL